MLFLTSNIIDAGPMGIIGRTANKIRNTVMSAAVIAYVHQNIMTKQDLTKYPEVSSQDITEYIIKCQTTFAATKASLELLFTEKKTETEELIATDEKTIEKADDKQ